MNENMTNTQNGNDIVEWVIPPSPVEERKEIAKLFEKYLVTKMQSGAIEVDPAKQVAELFVKIFQDATSDERLEKALDELNKQNDQLLKSFYLRVSEMRIKPVTNKLYDFMVELVQIGKVKEARDLYARYSSGEIKNMHDLLEVEKKIVSNKEISAAAEKIANFLKEKGKTAEAEQLEKANSEGSIKTLEDLKPWEDMIITSPGGSENPKEIAKTEVTLPQTAPLASVSPQEMNFGQRVWEGVHRLDQNLRKMLGMK